MASKRKTKVAGGVSTNSVDLEYSKDIYQEVTSLKDGEVKVIPNPNGDGISIVVRVGSQVTIVTKMYVRDGIFGKKMMTDTTVINDGGVVVNGRKV
jgi:hypothetical protein